MGRQNRSIDLVAGEPQGLNRGADQGWTPVQQQPGALCRKLWAAERGLYLSHLLRLSPESRRGRFGGLVTDSAIIDHWSKISSLNTVLQGAFVNGAVVGVGEFRQQPLKWPATAEIALSVEDLWQRQGVGTALMQRCIDLARNRGIVRLVIFCLNENHVMRKIARRFDAEVDVFPGGAEGILGCRAQTPLSILDEWMDDARGLHRYFFNLD